MLGAMRGGDHIGMIHQTSSLETSVVMRALRAVATVFRTTSGVDAEQACGFDAV